MNSPSQHSNLNAKDQRFHVSIILDVPGEELVLKRAAKDPAVLKNHEDIYIVLRDSFDTMERRLKNYVKRCWQDARHAS